MSATGRYYADPKPGASSGSPTWVQVPKALGPSSTAFPGHKQGAGREAGLLGLEPAPIWDPGRARRGPLTTCATAPGPVTHFLKEEELSLGNFRMYSPCRNTSGSTWSHISSNSNHQNPRAPIRRPAGKAWHQMVPWPPKPGSPCAHDGGRMGSGHV